MANVSLHLLKSRIDRATVTHGDLGHDDGTLTVSGELLDAADIREHEQIHVWNVTRGLRCVATASRGPDQSGIVCGASDLAQPGDVVTLSTFAEVDVSVADAWRPVVVVVDAHNCVTETIGHRHNAHAA
ncbi:MAG TPA: aspartate 1-decarboxylase [Kofleriaceae bacterium]|nr:aspartate 1-decarboxylase [Kofleriaceae bacterium]